MGKTLELTASGGNICTMGDDPLENEAPNAGAFDQALDDASEGVCRPSNSDTAPANTPDPRTVQAGECPTIMPPCPDGYLQTDPIPNGWQRYHGNSSWFHCQFDGLLQNCKPAGDSRQNECFYDHAGNLVDENSKYSGCRGTPNDYDSEKDTFKHAILDRGGVLMSGVPAFWESRMYEIEVNALELDLVEIEAYREE